MPGTWGQGNNNKAIHSKLQGMPSGHNSKTATQEVQHEPDHPVHRTAIGFPVFFSHSEVWGWRGISCCSHFAVENPVLFCGFACRYVCPSGQELM